MYDNCTRTLPKERLLSAVIETQETHTLNIGPETVVIFHYTLRNESGTELETSRGSDPSVYLHGANNIIRGLESAMTGKAAGDIYSATVAPEQAYGLHNPDKAQRVPVKHLAFKGKLRAGDVVQLSTREGHRPVTITKVGRHSADVDTNHPLAGQALTFDIEIVEVRAASSEELSNGHAHGPGGHQH